MFFLIFRGQNCIKIHYKLPQSTKFSWNHAPPPKPILAGHGYNLLLLFFFKFKVLLKYTPKLTKFTVKNNFFGGAYVPEPPSKRVAII